MSDMTSEQALSSLERSNEPFIQSIDKAFDVLGLQVTPLYSLINNTATTSKSDSANFRGQWVLKWLIKRLFQEIEINSDAASADKIWLLLKHLLDSIPSAQLRDILVERRFAELLGKGLGYTHGTESSEHDKLSTANGDETLIGRSAKRRKLSNETSLHTLAGLRLRIDVLLATSTTLGSKRNGSDEFAHTARWVENTEAADRVLSQILEYAARALALLDSDENGSIVVQLFQSVNQWLEIWTSFKPAKTTKQNAHVLFSELLLPAMLDLLQLRSKSPNQTTFSTLERLIALHTVLPCREAFEVSLKAHKLTGSSQISREQAITIAKDISKPLGQGLATLLGDKGISSHLLLSVAGRIVPRTDIPRRRAETLWFEAFHFTLQMSATSKYKIQLTDKQASLEAIDDSVFGLDAEDRPASRHLLEVFSDLNLEPTSIFWREFVRRSLSSKRTRLEELSKIIGISNAIFATSHGETELLDLLGDRANTIDLADHALYITELIVPVLGGYARARQLPRFVNFWRAKLEADIETHNEELLPSRCFWDDPRLLRSFEDVCRQSNHFSFFDEFLSDLNERLAVKPGAVAHGTKTCVVIARSIFRALDGSIQGQELLSRYATSIFNHTITTLSTKARKMSQQWRFWDLLETMLNSDALKVNYNDLQQEKLTWPSLGRLSDPGDTITQRMAFYKAFCLRISLFQHFGGKFRSLSEDYIIEVIESYREARSSATKSNQVVSMEELETGWDGSVHGMDSPWKIISACLSRMTALPISSLMGLSRIDEILSTLIEISSLGLPSNSHGPIIYTNMVVAAEAILDMVMAVPEADLMDLFLKYQKQRSDTSSSLPERLPKFVQGLVDRKIKKAPAKKLLQTLFNICQRSEMTVQGYVDCLSAIYSLVGRRPAMVNSSWRHLVCCTERKFDEFDLSQCVAAGGLVEKLTATFVSHAISHHEQGGDSELHEMVRWALHATKKHTKGLRTAFHGFVVLGTVTSKPLNDLSTKSRGNQDILTDIQALQEMFLESAVEIVGKLIKKSPTKVQCFMARKFLHALVHLKPEKSSDPEILSLANTISQKLDDRDPGDVKSGSKALTRGELRYLASHVTRSNAVEETQAFMNGLVRSTSHPNGLASLKSDSTLLETEALDDFIRVLNAVSTIDITTGLAQQYLALANFVKNLSPETFAKSPELVPGMHKLVYLDGALTETSAQALLFRLEISRMILEKQAKLINQHVIDSILQALTLLSSSVSKSKVSTNQNDPEASHIFDILCTIMSILLIRYRQRLNGRYHLLLPALQNLLKCLFCPPSQNVLNMTPATYPSKAAFLESLPHWLNPRDHGSMTALPPGSAARFSRILQTLCEPSASSAHHTLRRKSRQAKSYNLGLVDETKVLQRQVSQHTQYLLQTYCQSTLDGYIAPEVSDKVLPGMFAVMAATDIEVLRGVNAGMNESQRAIWRDLYGDWRRSAK